MSPEERYWLDTYQMARCLTIHSLRVPVGTKGAEKNELVFWPSHIATWPNNRGLDALDYAAGRILYTALEAEREGALTKLFNAGKQSGYSGGSSGDSDEAAHMTFLDPVQYADVYAEAYGTNE